MTEHACQYVCWIPEYDQGPEDGIFVQAHSPNFAATHYMEWYEANNAEFPVGAGGKRIEVAVAGPRDETPSIFVVSGEIVPQYYARIRATPGELTDD